MSKIFTAEISHLTDIISYIRECLGSLGSDKEAVDTAHVICDEFITNIIKNAYDDDSTRSIDGIVYKNPLHVTCHRNNEQLTIEFIDWGRPFNPLEYQDEVRDREAEGGFGIHIAKNLASHISYQRQVDKNVLLFKVYSEKG